MRISRHLASVALTGACLAATAAPSALAKSRGVHYAGTTRDGDAISFTLAGSKVTQLKAYTPTRAVRAIRRACRSMAAIRSTHPVRSRSRA